ncbi:MAG: DUF3501 family protein [Myxococcales bacterium]|jgi:hypothetical protein
MKKVDRSELLDLGGYEQIRNHFRARVIEMKKNRRANLGAHMSITFENHDTMLLQIQEMLRTERISDEKAIAHELETYNELIPEPGQLSATHFIEYDDPDERRQMLTKLADVREHLHLRIGDRRFTASFYVHHGEEMDRIPAVNYLTFDVGADQAAALRDEAVPAALEVTHSLYQVSLDLPKGMREALADDLES